MSRAQTVVVLGDGAAWLWNLAADKFPFAVQILDLFHTLEHLEALAKLLYPPELCSEAVGRWKEWLFEDKVQAVIDQGRGEAKRFRGDKRKDVESGTRPSNSTSESPIRPPNGYYFVLHPALYNRTLLPGSWVHDKNIM